MDIVVYDSLSQDHPFCGEIVAALEIVAFLTYKAFVRDYTRVFVYPTVLVSQTYCPSLDLHEASPGDQPSSFRRPGGAVGII